MTNEITITNPVGSPTIVTFPGKKRTFGGGGLYVALIGNISDGFEAYGPFSSFDLASDYADRFDDMSWIMELHDAEPPQKPFMA